MQRSLKRSMLALVPALFSALVLFVPAGSADVLQGTTLSCNDGTQVSAPLDATALLDLTDAVTAMSLYPAGNPPLSCAVTSSSGVDPNGPQDFATGGGQLLTSCGLVNFAFDVHVANDAPVGPGQPGVGGTFNVGTGATSPCHGSSTAKVDCVVVTGNLAQWTAHVTQAEGSPFFGVPGQEIAVSATDNPDQLTQEAGLFTSDPCEFLQTDKFLTPIARGNITVHDG